MARADLVAAAIARNQHGLFTRAGLIDGGVAPSTIGDRTRSGQWHQVCRSVFRFPGGPPSRLELLRAAQLADERLIASGTTAGALLGLGPLDPADGQRICFTSTDRIRLSGPWTIAHVGWLPRRHMRTSTDGVVHTTPERTIIDLAGSTRQGRLRRIVDSGLAARLLRVEDVTTELNCWPGRQLPPGGPRLQAMLTERSVAGEVPRSELEQRLLDLVDERQLPKPALQHLVPWARQSGIGRVDFAYPEARVIVETDGRRWHSDPDAFELDRRRDQIAAAHGWLTLRFTYRQITEHPDDVERTIRGTLARRCSPEQEPA